MVKFVSAVIAAAAFAGVLTLLWTTGMRLDARSAGDAAPQSTPVTQIAPAPAAVAISPELMRLEVARDLAVIRNSVEQLANKLEELAAKQDQMTLSHRRRSSRTSYRRGHPHLCPGRSRPRRAKKREGLHRGNSPRSHRLCLPRHSPMTVAPQSTGLSSGRRQSLLAHRSEDCILISA
jgi:hypothetical protein